MTHSRRDDNSLWLPGFGTDQPDTYPDLFSALNAPEQDPTPTLPPATSPAEHPAARWRPTLVLPTAAQEFAWPEWADDCLQGIEGQVTKFEANMAALQLMCSLKERIQPPTTAERTTLLRYTGWGGLPASFNLDGRDPAWVARAKRLHQSLTEDQYESAKGSVNNAHYTEPMLIHWIWAALRRIGFAGGAVLEPSAGIGHFIGCMPRDIASRSRVTAVELDTVSGEILKSLYSPYGVDVRISGLERAHLADASFDLVIGNVPFGNYRVSDNRNRPYSRASIHNWFVGKALDLVRPGGLVCVITSSYFLDESDASGRAHAAAEAELVSAFRFPQGTFERIATTSTQADLVVLRKRQPGATPEGIPEWLDLEYVPESMRHPSCYDKYMRINRWMVRNPSHVLGRIDRISTGFEARPTAVLDGSLAEALDAAIELVPKGTFGLASILATATGQTRQQTEKAPAPDGARPGSHIIKDGRLHIVEDGELLDVHDRRGATARQRIAGMVEIRDKARCLLQSQLTNASDATLASQRGSLNACYDRFVGKFGYLSSRANALAFARDPDYPLLLSLEHYDDEDESATKADIFFRRTVSRIEEPSSAEAPDEAMVLSLQWRGRVDPDYMGRLLNAEPGAVMADLASRGMVYLDPETGSYETADAYLSGDVKRKLNVAAAAGPSFAAHTAALERVIPEDLPPAAIAPRLGAVWIPAEDVEAFIREVLSIEGAAVAYSPLAGAWSLQFNDWAAKQNVTCIQTYGTRRMHALELVQQALNVQTPTVRDPHPEKDGVYVVNKEETLAAREKLGELKDRFAAWAFEDIGRRDRLCRIYNDLFNNLRQRDFDGSHLKLPGFSHCYALHKSQLNAIWRIVQTGNTGLFHAVGAGKTAIMAAAGMELRRLGLANKPAFIVPNHCLEQFTAEFVRCYPSASVLMATKEDLVRERRREFVSRVATGSWDAVIMTHSTFCLIPMSAEYTSRFIKDVIHDIEIAIRMASADSRSNRIVKQLERMKKTWKVRLEKLDNADKRDDFLCWEALGVDAVHADEAHGFKNLYRHTKMARIAGLPLSNSQRAFDLYLKTRYTMGLYRGQERGVVLATATPVANSMAEIHVFQRYLQPKKLSQLGLEQFDAWAATFGETVTALEVAPDGSGYRLNTRFARFINVPDLMAIFCDVSDIRTKEMLNLPVPTLKGGKPRVVVSPASPQLKAYVKSLVLRAERLKTVKVDPRKDNFLKITGEGRKAALDIRLVMPAVAADPQGKVAKCALEVHTIWQRTAGLKRAQLVFCDLSTPKGGSDFSVYEALRDALISNGIPAEEVAFIHDAETDTQKARLFRKVREGKVRVLLGSTDKMGTGTNVQRRLVALHELDCPWRPCDIEQREGRILRQGNECEEVEIIRYVTEGSFDAYSWQVVTSKAKFIAQVMSGDKAIRSLEDVELATLTYAEVKALASGNPKIIEKAGVDAEVAKLASLFSVWRNDRYRTESEIANLPMRIESFRNLLADLNNDATTASGLLDVGVQIQVGGRAYTGREPIGECLREVIKAARSRWVRRSTDETVGSIGDFALCVFAGDEPGDVHLVLKGRTAHECRPCQQGPALYASLVEALHGIEVRRTEIESRLALMSTKLEDLRQQLARPFEHEGRLANLLERQRALAKELDLDKNEVGTDGLDAAEEQLAA